MSQPTVTSGNLYLFDHLISHIEQLREVHYCRDIIESTKGVEERKRLMTLRGHEVKYQRVEFKGGIGSYKFLIRRKKFRLQISANVKGFDRDTSSFGAGVYIKKKKKQYYAYAWCIEI